MNVLSKIGAVTAVALGVLFLTPLAQAGDEGWMANLDEAKKQAKQENKPILVDFTGSDWCGWCIKLNEEVFSTKEFKDYAKEKLILVEVDFPRSKKQTDDQKQYNQTLAQEYKIQGFPTIIILDSQGKQIGTLGYMRGGPEAFLTELQKITKA